MNFLNLRSGYVLRANDRLPRQGSRTPGRILMTICVTCPHYAMATSRMATFVLREVASSAEGTAYFASY